jgi:hypothetical protein
MSNLTETMSQQGYIWSFVPIGKEFKDLSRSQHWPIRCRRTSLICTEIAGYRTWPRQCHNKAICEVSSESVKNWRIYRIHNIDQSDAGAPHYYTRKLLAVELGRDNVTKRPYLKFRPNRSRIEGVITFTTSTNQMPSHLINMYGNCWLSNLTGTMSQQGHMWSFVQIGQELKELSHSQHRPIRCRRTSLIYTKIAGCRTWPRQCHNKVISEVSTESVKNWRSYRIHNIDQSDASVPH